MRPTEIVLPRDLHIREGTDSRRRLTAVLLVRLVAAVVDAVAVLGLREAQGQIAAREVSQGAGGALLRRVESWPR